MAQTLVSQSKKMRLETKEIHKAKHTAKNLLPTPNVDFVVAGGVSRKRRLCRCDKMSTY